MLKLIKCEFLKLKRKPLVLISLLLSVFMPLAYAFFLADVYDALVSRRVYKKSYSHEEAMKMILGGECGAFNPVLLQCLTEAQDKIKVKGLV